MDFARAGQSDYRAVGVVLARTHLDDTAGNGDSSYFVWLNQGKESLVLDIKTEGDVALIRRLLAKADVLVQNLAPYN